MLKIRNDPYWRTNLGNGNWLTNQTDRYGQDDALRRRSDR